MRAVEKRLKSNGLMVAAANSDFLPLIFDAETSISVESMDEHLTGANGLANNLSGKVFSWSTGFGLNNQPRFRWRAKAQALPGYSWDSALPCALAVRRTMCSMPRMACRSGDAWQGVAKTPGQRYTQAPVNPFAAASRKTALGRAILMPHGAAINQLVFRRALFAAAIPHHVFQFADTQTGDFMDSYQ